MIPNRKKPTLAEKGLMAGKMFIETRTIRIERVEKVVYEASSIYESMTHSLLLTCEKLIFSDSVDL